MKLPALPGGAGGAPALLFPVNQETPKMPTMQNAQMPTILHKDPVSGRFRIIPHKPLYYFSDWDRCWYRVLMMEEGYCLRVRLTPIDSTDAAQWAEILDDRIQWCGAAWTVYISSKDRYTHALPAEIVHQMHCYLRTSHATRLLTGDIWNEILPLWPTEYERSSDVTNWLGRCGYNDGISLSKIQKNPPTWDEIREKQDARREEERAARIAAVLGDATPLTEAEKELGLSLEGHDWSYSYSDCIDTWRRGESHKKELEFALKALPVERALLVWKAFVHPYNEKYWRCPV
jgi:hypothetical protein